MVCALTALAIGSSLLACEFVMVTPAGSATADLQLAYSVLADPAAASAKANFVRVQAFAEGAELDTTIAFVPGAENRVRIAVDASEGNQQYQVEVTLQRDTAQLFHGSASVQVAEGRTNTVQINVAPVVYDFEFANRSDRILAIGDSTRPAPLFATGDTISGVPLVWSSSNAAVASVNASTGEVVARAVGTTMISARPAAASSSAPIIQRDFRVCPRTQTIGVAPRFAQTHSAGRFTFGTYEGTRVLDSGGIIFGTSASDVVAGVDLRGNLGAQLDLSAPVCAQFVTGGAYTRTRLQIIKAAPRPPVSVVQETYSTGGNFVLVRYTFLNTSGSAITLRVGLALDWDLMLSASPIDDQTIYNPVLNATQALDNISAGFSGASLVGVAGVGNTAIASYVGGTNGGVAPDPINAAEYYTRIGSGISSATLGPADIRQFVGFGDLVIAPGQSSSVMFALAGTSGFNGIYNSNGYINSVNAARAAAANFPIVP